MSERPPEASSGELAQGQPSEEQGEDIDAFLAQLESESELAASKPPAPSKPDGASPVDPFADAFAQLEQSGPALDEEAARAALAALAASSPSAAKASKPPAPAPAPKPEAQIEAQIEAKSKSEPAPKPAPEPKPEASKPAAPRSPAEADAEATPEADAKPKPKPKPPAAPAVPVVQKVRSPGFRFAMWSLGTGALLTPSMLWGWLVGALAATWISTGWLLAIVATVAMMALPLAARYGTGRWRVKGWMALMGVLGLGLVLGLAPERSAQALSARGHWAASAVAQLAGWDADHVIVRGAGRAGQLVAQPLASWRGVQAAPELLMLGQEQSLVAWRQAHEAAAKDAAAKDNAPKDAAPKDVAKPGEEGAAQPPSPQP